MTYRLKLTVDEDKSTLSLLKGEEIIEQRNWLEERDMGKQLLSALDSIFVSSGVDKKVVERFDIDGKAKENFTSRRIAETVQKVYTFAINQE